jgi:hypothetical protein
VLAIIDSLHVACDGESQMWNKMVRNKEVHVQLNLFSYLSLHPTILPSMYSSGGVSIWWCWFGSTDPNRLWCGMERRWQLHWTLTPCKGTVDGRSPGGCLKQDQQHTSQMCQRRECRDRNNEICYETKQFYHIHCCCTFFVLWSWVAR